MVYESDFYTTRRPYSAPRPTITSYSVTRRQVNWDQHPTVPRPSQVPPILTAFGRVEPLRSPSGAPNLSRVPPRTHRRVLFNSPTAISTTVTTTYTTDRKY